MRHVTILGRVIAVVHALLALMLGAGVMAILSAIANASSYRGQIASILAPMAALLVAAAAGLLAIGRRAWRDPASAAHMLTWTHAPILALGLSLAVYGRFAQAAAARSAARGGGLLGGFGDLVLIAGVALVIIGGLGLACAIAATRARRTHQSVGL